MSDPTSGNVYGNDNGITLWVSNYNNISENELIDTCMYEDEFCSGNIFKDNICPDDDFTLYLIILISSISGGAVIGIVTILLIRRKRKSRIQNS
ncbi:MAG: hypothetical protein HWN81_02380 [Candidatus Lokiarchaeota archaeon]|nr:hypothetical protein [Candidatus Lokiarchaeota archaeon]